MCRRGAAALVHAHVERSFAGKRETAIGDIELRRRHAEIDQDSIHFRHAEREEVAPYLAEAAVDQDDPLAESLEPPARGRKCCEIAIDAHEPTVRARRIEDALGMSAR